MITNKVLPLALLACMPMAATAATPYPSKQVVIIAPAGVGGPVDLATRVAADFLSRQSGVTFIVENRAGAGGIIGTENVAKAAPDGYTLLLSTSSMPISQVLYKKKGSFDSSADFVHAAIFAQYPNVLIGNLNVPAKNFAELVSLAKATPEGMTYGTAGNGTAPHLSAVMLADRGGFSWRHIPYKGAAPALTDVIGGQVQLSMQGIAGAYGQIKAGKVRAYAVTSRERVADLPDVPSVSELYPDYEYRTWLGLSTPAGTPADVVQRLSALVAEVVKTPAFGKAMEKMGTQATFVGEKEFSDIVRKDVSRFGQIVEKNHIKME